MRIIATTLVAASLFGCAASDEPEVKAPEALEESKAPPSRAAETAPPDAGEAPTADKAAIDKNAAGKNAADKNTAKETAAAGLAAEAAPPFQLEHFETAAHSVASFDMAPFELDEDTPETRSRAAPLAEVETEPSSTVERIAPDAAAFDALRVDDAMIALLKERETLQLKAYRGPSGAWLVGYGHKRTARGGMEISEAEAEALLRQDLAETEAAVKRALKRPVTRHEYSAMVGLAYNIGVGAFARSSVLRAFNEGDRGTAADAFMAWNKTTVNGQRKTLTHLTERRAREREHFLRGAG